MPRPVAPAMTRASARATSLRTGSTGSLIGRPLMRMGPLVRSPRPGRLGCKNGAIKRKKRRDGEEREDGGLEVQGLPEHLGETQRREPERFNVVGKSRPARQEDEGQGSQQQDPTPLSG